MTDLSTWTPQAVDEALSEIYDRLAPLAHRLERATAEAKRIGDQLRTNSRTYYTQGDFDRALAAKDAAASAYRDVEAETAPYDAEFKRRGGWSRAWLCLAAGGHVHNTMSCSTCFWNTRFGWLPELSGMEDDQAIDQIGSDLCSVCWPSAPVIAKPRSIFHGTEIEAQQARAKRAAEKAEREAKKAAKAIGPLRVSTGYPTLIETLHAAKAWLTDSQESWTRTTPEDVALVAQAIAAKLSTTAEAEIAAAAKRAAKRK